jgi:hypothetical protein
VVDLNRKLMETEMKLAGREYEISQLQDKLLNSEIMSNHKDDYVKSGYLK